MLRKFGINLTTLNTTEEIFWYNYMESMNKSAASLLLSLAGACLRDRAVVLTCLQQQCYVFDSFDDLHSCSVQCQYVLFWGGARGGNR